LGVNLRKKATVLQNELTKTNGAHFKTEFIRSKKFSRGEVYYGHLIEVFGFHVDNCFPVSANLQNEITSKFVAV